MDLRVAEFDKVRHQGRADDLRVVRNVVKDHEEGLEFLAFVAPLGQRLPRLLRPFPNDGVHLALLEILEGPETHEKESREENETEERRQ